MREGACRPGCEPRWLARGRPGASSGRSERAPRGNPRDDAWREPRWLARWRLSATGASLAGSRDGALAPRADSRWAGTVGTVSSARSRRESSRVSMGLHLSMPLAAPPRFPLLLRIFPRAPPPPPPPWPPPVSPPPSLGVCPYVPGSCGLSPAPYYLGPLEGPISPSPPRGLVKRGMLHSQQGLVLRRMGLHSKALGMNAAWLSPSGTSTPLLLLMSTASLLLPDSRLAAPV